jgi:hypothetical protein
MLKNPMNLMPKCQIFSLATEQMRQIIVEFSKGKHISRKL